MLETLPAHAPDLLWVLLLGLGIAFLLAFSVGANDVSNSFGTSVGSRVLTVTQACILATVFEVAGATLLGYSVCDTFRRNVYDVSQYEGAQRELMFGALACLIGSAAWNLIATALKMPISGTHSIVGATIGFSVVLRGWSSIKWHAMARIVASWFVSPLVSGIISSLIYLFISKTIIRRLEPLHNGCKALPLFYGLTIFINVASIVIGGPIALPWYTGLLISLLVACGAICCTALIVAPRLRRRITDELAFIQNQMKPTGRSARRPSKPIRVITSITGQDNPTFKPDEAASGSASKPAELNLSAAQLQEVSVIRPPVAPKPAFLCRQGAGEQLDEIDLSMEPAKLSTGTQLAGSQSGEDSGSSDPAGWIGAEKLEVHRLFSSLQILTACFASFAHGTNDVSNAVAPLIPIWNIYDTGAEQIEESTPVWILLFGGIGICTGLWAWGRAVMSTVGSGLTVLTPSKGFAIELGAAVSVLAATKFGMPISTTHCKVGSVVIVGLVSERFCGQDNLLPVSKGELESASERSPGKQDQQQQQQQQGVDWKLFGGIALTWVVTVPLSALMSGLVMIMLKWFAFP